MNDIYSGLAIESERSTARAARTGTVKHGGQRYTLTFDPEVPGYHVTDQRGEHVVTLTGKKITVARRDLREHLGD